MNQKQATTLIILDGFGHREETENNAIALAHTPHIDREALRVGDKGLVGVTCLDVHHEGSRSRVTVGTCASNDGVKVGQGQGRGRLKSEPLLRRRRLVTGP